MKNTVFLFLVACQFLVACPAAFAQTRGDDAATPQVFVYQSAQGAGTTAGMKAVRKDSAPVQGAPYSATMTTESVQTLADGNRIVVKTTGLVARDSLGRTRQQMELPSIGNLLAANLPQVVFIQDPVAQAAYTLNLTDKTAHTMPVVPLMTTEQRVNGPAGPGSAFGTKVVIGGPLLPDGPPSPPPSADVVFVRKEQIPGEQAQTASTDLGAQVVEGVLANGTRTTLTIPAGQIGNDRPITIVTEVWTSPDLKTIVYSRRSDPRTGEQTFRLTNIQRTEPDAALFTVPPDFTFIDGPQRVIYGPK